MLSLLQNVAHAIMEAAESHTDIEPKYSIELFDTYIDCEKLAQAAIYEYMAEKQILIKALQNVESFSALSARGTILEQINVFASKALFDVGELEEKERCDICGDIHDEQTPRECETGDGA